jgi:hypothetical protein
MDRGRFELREEALGVIGEVYWTDRGGLPSSADLDAGPKAGWGAQTHTGETCPGLFKLRHHAIHWLVERPCP